MRPIILLVAVSMLAACDNTQTQRRRNEEPPVTPGCGNGVLEEGEACDLTDFGNHDCTTEGFDQGTLLCSDTCALVTTNCTKRCGNGALDPGEQCDGELQKPSCGAFGYGVCSATCTRDTTHCVQDAFTEGGGFTQAEVGGSWLADLPPTGFGDLITAVPGLGYLQTYKWTVDKGLITDRKLSTFKAPMWPIAGELDGVTGLDVAVIDQDSSVDRFRYDPSTSGFSRQSLGSLTDGGTGCLAAPFVGVGRIDSDQVDDLVAYGCGHAGSADDFVVFHGGAAPVTREVLAANGIVAASLGDLSGDQLQDILYVSSAAPTELRGFRMNGAAFEALPAQTLPVSPQFLAGADLDADGDLDLVVADGTSVHVLENTGTGFAERGTPFTATVTRLNASDLDLDGRPDIWFVDATGLHIQRNNGGFSFSPFSEALGDGGTLLSVSTADVDNDGDPDLAATFAVSAGATSTTLLRNRVR
ncbi:MAG: FG-GAP repeat domain-containing protein [Myxococcaceae bacterium]